MNKTIAILGCGWLGFPLAERLLNKNYIVKGSVTSAEKISLLSNKGIQAFQVQLTDKGINGNVRQFLNEADILIIAIPPGLRKNPSKNYVKEIQLLQDEIVKARLTKVVYISSTSVFKDEGNIPVYTEKDIPNKKSSNAKQLIEVEHLWKHNDNFSTTILRFGGLIGQDRHPVKYLSGRKDIKSPEAPVNLIHLNDAISIILKIIEAEAWGNTFHGVFPAHPAKSVYYTETAKSRSIPLPLFSNEKPSRGKIISSEETRQKLGFSFECKP